MKGNQCYELYEEIALKNHAFFRLRGTKMWLYVEVKRKYPNISTERATDPFVLFGQMWFLFFSCIWFCKKRGDLRLKLTKKFTQVNLFYIHQAHGSH